VQQEVESVEVESVITAVESVVQFSHFFSLVQDERPITETRARIKIDFFIFVLLNCLFIL
jgi:hypothetical protein